MPEHRLQRSHHNKVLGGLCGGLGEYFNIDPTIIRIFWVLAFVFVKIPVIIAYILGLIIIPVNEGETESKKDNPITEKSADPIEESMETVNSQIETNSIVHEKVQVESVRKNLIWGWVIITLGILLFIQNQGYFDQIKEYIIPGLLIGAGVLVLVRGLGQTRK